MFTHPDELERQPWYNELKHFSAEDYDKLQKARDKVAAERCEQLARRFDALVKFIRSMFSKKTM